MSSENMSLEKVNNGKAVEVTAVEEDEELAYSGNVAAKYLGSVADRRDMKVLGREQVLRVRSQDKT
jgi:hypothetical protein